jgi:hypothetical protein
MDQPQPIARLVLVTPDGAVVGSLPGVPVALPWWQDAESVVQAVRERHGVEVTVLRLLAAERDEPHGGEVTYLAEVREPVPADPWNGRLEPHPLRQPWAEPGGPAADLDWARSVLAGHGIATAGQPAQVRNWNLSSVWRIPLSGRSAWLKVVPPFFSHEGRAIAALAGRAVPRLLGQDGGRILLAEIPGEDMYQAALPQLLDMVTLLVEIQAAWIDRVEALLAIGLPDWGGSALPAAVADAVERTRSELSVGDAEALDRFVADLPHRFADIGACAIPDTLVHGDFHPGNVRGSAARLTLLDWGDCGVGHPLLDQPAFLSRVAAEHGPAIRAHWNRQWLTALPGGDPARASELLAPVAAARQAVLYRRFLDNVEPAEHVYHRRDPAQWLRRTAVLLQQER